jgi:hypothetical protein
MRAISIFMSLLMLTALTGCQKELTVDKVVLSMSSDLPSGGETLTALRIRFYADGVHFPEAASTAITDAADIPSIEIPLSVFKNPVEAPVIINLPYGGSTFNATDGVARLHITGWAEEKVVTYYEGELDLSNHEIVSIRLTAIDPLCDEDGDGFLNCNKKGCCSDGNTPLADCEPEAADANPWATEPACEPCDDTVDQDCSGGDQACVDEDNDGVQDCLEEAEGCGVGNPNQAPGLAEVCDGEDNNCDGQVDEGFFLAIGNKLLGPGDDCGFGVCDGGVVECDASAANGLSCTTANKASEEDCSDDLDNDCDGQVNNGCNQNDWDGDGQTEDEGDTRPYDSAYYSGAAEGCCLAANEGDVNAEADCDKNLDGTVEFCAADDLDGDGQSPPQDCNDEDPTIYDGAPEKCGDGILQGCFNDPDCASVIDGDGDGWSPPADCDDSDPNRHPEAVEACDGIDNNCNQLVDEGNPDTDASAPCGSDVGECVRGTTTCANASGYKGTIVCADETVPAPDVCDEVDNDCDGDSDESYTSGGTVTLTDLDGTDSLVKGDSCGVGACAGGDVICGESATQLACSSHGQSSPEICDGIDNDCDGEIDEDFKIDGSVTYTDLNGTGGLTLGKNCGTGSCGGGKVVCSDDQTTLTCSTVNKASQDICDNKDNDCDGDVDEDYKDGGAVTYTALNGASGLVLGEGCGVGACLGGIVTCSADKITLTCSTDTKADADVCDGEDNDCDGKTDEDYKNGGSVKYTDLNGQGNKVIGNSCGVGECSGGKVECAPDTISLTCSTQGNSSPETCDGADNDCDGSSDEDFKNGGTVKYTSLDGTKNLVLDSSCGKGACSGGKVECSADGVTLTCTTEGQASADICDGTDNDCDGKTDEDFTANGSVKFVDLDGSGNKHKGSTCGTGSCNGGSVECTADGTSLQCSTHDQAGADVCDGKDNDCDGDVDEEFKDGGSVSMTDMAGNDDLVLNDSCGEGSCSGGKVVCGADANSLICNSEGSASAELCDGKDNDCDGSSDEDFKNGGTSKFTDLAGNGGKVLNSSCGEGTCSGGKVVCRADGSGMECNSEGNATAETCDNKDNDCDGQTDEDYKDGGISSYTDLSGNAGLTLGDSCGTGECKNGEVVCRDDEAGLACTSEDNATNELCDNKDNDCDGKTDEDYKNGGSVTMTDLAGNAGLVLSASCGAGECGGGKVQCNGDKTGLICSSESDAATESCDNKDNDCDGSVDEDFGAAGSVKYTDLSGKTRHKGQNCGAGVCTGSQVSCTADGNGLMCPNESNASAELCDNLDNDCDGDEDEDFTDGSITYTDLSGNAGKVLGDNCGEGNCDGGKVACGNGGNSLVCTTESGAGSQVTGELCDGQDNDCDGEADENYKNGGDITMTDLAGNANLALGATCGAGACSGSKVACSGDGNGLVCPNDSNAVAESCDGADNDCDGQTDEDYKNGGSVTMTDLAGNANLVLGSNCGTGACAGSNVECSGDGNGLVCPNDSNAVAESCDGADNDCDGQTDENYKNGGDVTMTDLAGNANLVLGSNCGTGACAGSSVECSADGNGLVCPNDANAVTELCDNADNDCDGQTDENYKAGGNVSITDLGGNAGLVLSDSCGTGDCAAGAVVCNGAQTGLECDSEVGAGSQVTTESCDGNDEDCDGALDNGVDAGDEDVCTEGVCGGTSTPACSAGNWECNSTSPDFGSETLTFVCDGLDNDCDGVVDEDCVPTDGHVDGIQKVSDTAGNFKEVLSDDDLFGSSVAALGDFDGSGQSWVAVGAPGYDSAKGAVWLMKLKDDGTVNTVKRIDSDDLTDGLIAGDQFGTSVSQIGDVNGDGVGDIAVGAVGVDQPGLLDTGAVYILMLNANGTVKSDTSIEEGFVETLFGQSVTGLGDLDGDGTPDLAVGAPSDSTFGTDAGLIWTYFLNANGSVKSSRKTTAGDGLPTQANSQLGYSLANLGDINGDGITDIAVGAPEYTENGKKTGITMVLFLEETGAVKTDTSLGENLGGFPSSLAVGVRFGSSVAGIGDVNKDGIPDIAIGASDDGNNPTGTGATWVLLLNTAGVVTNSVNVYNNAGGFSAGLLAADDAFGSALAGPGDVDGDGISDVIVGTPGDDDGGTDHGAFYVLFSAQSN